jgi:tetratricopeptide (TPR) repeat protein
MMNRGVHALQNKQYAQAYRHLRQAYDTNPTNTLVVFNLAATLEELGDATQRVDLKPTLYAEAQRYYELLHARQPHIDEVTLKLARLAHVQGQWPQAQKWYGELLAQHPQNAMLLFGLANVYDDQGNPAQAEALYRQALVADATFLPAYNNLALLLSNNDQLAEAEALLRTALKQKATYLNARLNLGNLYLKQRNWKQAVKQFDTVVKQQPTLAYGHLGKANALFQLQQWEASLAHYQQVEQLMPEQAASMSYYMAIAHFNLKRYNQAQSYAQVFLASNPQPQQQRLLLQRLIVAAKMAEAQAMVNP